jgi:hypothetical protein
LSWPAGGASKTSQSRSIRRHLIDAVRAGRADIVAETCEQFGITRQAVHRHLTHLTRERFLEAVGTTRGRTYRLGPNRWQKGNYALGAITEDRIYAGDLAFSHTDASDRDCLVHLEGATEGTTVGMYLSPKTERILASVFDEYTDADTLDFSKTVVPIRLALYEGEQLVSRSQAKRIMNRVERFRNVVLDFAGVDMVGRSFVDEIFRVFSQRHPEIVIAPINMNAQVQREVGRFSETDGSSRNGRQDDG